MARLLAFDTSTETLLIALCLPDAVLTVEGAGGALASARLIPEALALLERGGCSLQQLDAIGFGRGPGAFTGLRSACAVAQGLALGAGKPALPIDSLLIDVEDAVTEEPPFEPVDAWAAMDARMGEIYAARFRRDHAAQPWRGVSPAALYAPAQLAAIWQADPPALVAGSALAAYAATLPAPGARRHAAPIARAAALGRLARQAYAAGAAVDPALALPVYVRDKVAQTVAERAAARLGVGAAAVHAPGAG